MSKILKIATLISLLIGSQLHSQELNEYNFYMLYPSVTNSGYNNSYEGLNAHFIATRKWMSIPGAGQGLELQVNTESLRKNIYGLNIHRENVSNFSSTGFRFIYGRQLLLTPKLILGLGSGVGLNVLNSSFTPIVFNSSGSSVSDPVFANTGSTSMNDFVVRTNISLHNNDFFIGITNHTLRTVESISLERNSSFSKVWRVEGLYKFRPSDYWVVFPSFSGTFQALNSKYRLDMNVLYNQIMYAGIGLKRDLSVPIGLGVFLDNGLRIVYSYTSAALSKHQTMTSTHEVVLSLVRPIKAR